MNCSNCGKQIAEDARFCGFCGARTETGKQAAVKTVIYPEGSPRASESAEQKGVLDHLYLGDIEAQVAADEAQQYAAEAASDVPVEDFAPLNGSKKPVKEARRKLVVLISAILAAVIALSTCTAALLLVLGGRDMNVSVEGYISNSGDAYICYGKGRYVKITDNVKQAHITPDRKRAIAIDESGYVYLIDVKSGSKRTVNSFGEDTNVSALCVTDDMALLLAANKDGAATLWRYTYDISSFSNLIELSSCDGIAVSSSESVADEDISVAYSQNGNVYVIQADEASPEKIYSGSSSDTVSVHGVSSDGEAAVWSTGQGVYLYCDGRAEMINGADVSQSYSLITVPAADMLVVTASGGKVYMKQEDNKLVTATLPGALYSSEVMIDGDTLISLKTSNGRAEGVLVSVIEDTGASLFSLFLVKPDGSYRRIRERITHAVYGNAGTLYYVSSGSLYSYDVKKNVPTKIESDVASVNASLDGDSVYYVHHANDTAYGTLSVYSEKDGKQTVSTNVLVGSLTSHSATQRIDPRSMWFEVYQSPTTSSYTYNAVFHDGKQPRAVIRNIER